MAGKQAVQCAVFEDKRLDLMAKVAGEFYDLRKHIILKAKEAGDLLQIPDIIVKFAKDCGLKYGRQEICAQKEKGVPYRSASFSCSEES